MNPLHLVFGIAIAPVPTAAPSRGLAPCLHSPFHGVTQTLDTGEIIGEPDASDWGCIATSPGRGAAAGGQRLEAADVPAPTPTRTCLNPAAPNPMSVQTRLTVSIARSGPVRLAIYGQTWRHGPHEVFLVRTLSEATLNVGLFEFLWDRTDDQGQQVPAGIYRVVLEADGRAVCGDLQIQ